MLWFKHVFLGLMFLAKRSNIRIYKITQYSRYFPFLDWTVLITNWSPGPLTV